MKNVYEAPKAEKLAFDFTNTVVASGGEGGGSGSGSKTPGHGCSIMPNGNEIPGGAQGHEFSNQNRNKCSHI